jgi:hypothetical protein
MSRFLPAEGVLRTNPVWALENLGPRVTGGPLALVRDFHDEGVVLSPAARRWLVQSGHNTARVEEPAPEPGVVGLVYELPAGPGFVTPLRAELADNWRVAPNLPFRVPDLRTALTRLLSAAGMEAAELSGEFYAFHVQDEAGVASDGSSMTIAALLAVLRAMNEDKSLLRAVCSIVEEDKDGKLRAVDADSLEPKLKAFVREVGSGSLLVRPTCCPADAFTTQFDEVWRVDCYADLARRAEQSKLLAPFRRQTKLNAVRFDQARARLHHLAEKEHRYQVVLDQARTLLDHPREATVPEFSVTDVRQLIYDLHRHLGHFEEAMTAAAGEVERLKRQPAKTSYDEQARRTAALGSALLDAHRFEEGRQLLDSWFKRLDEDPLKVSPLGRIMVSNTLGRLEIFAGGPWQERFTQSLQLQKGSDPEGFVRTSCYLVHGLLRHGRLHDAERLIRKTKGRSGANIASTWSLHFAQATLARLRGERSKPCELDEQPLKGGPVGHPVGQYLQAAARQKPRSPEESARLLRRAAAFFEADLQAGEQLTLLSFLAGCARLRAAASEANPVGWQKERQVLGKFFRGRKGRHFLNWYREAWSNLGGKPDVEAAERFLARVPYF